MVAAMATTEPSSSRRIRAALALSGLTIEELAARIDQRGLGARTLRKLQDETDEREARPMELQAIAAATGIPYVFFTIPFAYLDDMVARWQASYEAEPATDRLDQIVERLERVEAALEAAATTRPADAAPAQPPAGLLRPPRGKQPTTASARRARTGQGSGSTRGSA